MSFINLASKITNFKPIGTKGRPGIHLEESQFRSLITSGHSQHQFPGQQSVLLTLRNRLKPSSIIEFSLDAIDAEQNSVVGFFDFCVVPQTLAFAERKHESKKPFSAQAIAILNEQQPINLRPINDLVALWLAQGYRAKDKTGFDGFSHLLVGTALAIARGLKANYFALLEVGGGVKFPLVRNITMQSYSKKYGARVINHDNGNMIIDI